MKFAPIIILSSLIFIGQFFTACSSGENVNVSVQNSDSNYAANVQSVNDPANPVKDNIEELELMVKLPAHPEEVSWREEQPQNQPAAQRERSQNQPQTGKKLTAVLKFSAEDANKIIAQAETHKPAEFSQFATESWFPAELIAQSELSGDETLKGNAYAANDFFQPPYTDGKITRVENSNYFILELFAK
jgi:hypothetical protein